jgi:phage tail-like protein
MSTLRPFALVEGGDAWARAAFHDAFLDHQAGVVELAWAQPESPPATGYGGTPAGMAFDAECRLYRIDREAGQVTRTLWRNAGPLIPAPQQPEPVELFEPEPQPPLGEFVSAAAPSGPLHDPRGVAVDVDDRLYVAEYGSARILVYDLWSRRLLRAVPTPPGTRPVDLAADRRTVWAALEGTHHLLRLTAHGEPRLEELPPEVWVASRIAVSPSGRMALLAGAGTADAIAVPADRLHDVISVPWATDLEWEGDDVLAIARRPGEDFVRWRMTPGALEVLLPLVARGYDGGGIVRTPDGRIAYGTDSAVRTAPVARVRYAQRGTVLTWRLDAGEYQAQWGRIFMDACIPLGTSVRTWCITTDDEFDEPAVPRDPPVNVALLEVRRPDLSPPMPPRSLVDVQPDWRPVYRRDSGRELAWVQPERGDVFVTYETPVPAGPGRFLWIWIELAGNSRLTPRIRTVRAETQAHDLLRRIPRTFSRDTADADFLRRFLAICDGLIDEMDGRAAQRQLLLDPYATPEDMLPWLASFLGMTLDDRWPAAARRELVANAAWLFRFRGTVPGLTKFLELYLGKDAVVLIEQFRLRGMGGALLGDLGAARSTSVLGGGFRVGGKVGTPGESSLDPTESDPYSKHAHRFTLLLRGALSDEQLAVVNDILEIHRPAHTIVELCTLGAGMRVGRGLHLGISTTIGRTGGFRTLQLGASALGRGAIVGRPESGTIPGSAVLGRDSRVG